MVIMACAYRLCYFTFGRSWSAASYQKGSSLRASSPESAPADEVQTFKQALENGKGRNGLAGASSQCLAALIKLYLRELPDDVWANVRDEIAGVVDGAAASNDVGDGGEGGAAGLHLRAQQLVGQLDPASADLVVWVRCHEGGQREGGQEQDEHLRSICRLRTWACTLVVGEAETDPFSLMQWILRGACSSHRCCYAHTSILDSCRARPTDAWRPPRAAKRAAIVVAMTASRSPRRRATDVPGEIVRHSRPRRTGVGAAAPIVQAIEGLLRQPARRRATRRRRPMLRHSRPKRRRRL